MGLTTCLIGLPVGGPVCVCAQVCTCVRGVGLGRGLLAWVGLRAPVSICVSVCGSLWALAPFPVCVCIWVGLMSDLVSVHVYA